ncbi:hypothetical protein [Winogradskyella sp.]|uniref:hypothetical protein n=1 Tax=Winogradskyella sp. TaxID=1883156 RepID=UPI00260F1C85|nr:hypothetical protein [Winogradskyella sp.]
MNTLKVISAFALVLVFFTTTMSAQTNHPLLGKWEATYTEKNESYQVIYEFKIENDRLKCYTYSIEKDKGEDEKYSSVIMKKVIFKGTKGTGVYIFEHEGKNYEVQANLKLENHNTLKISYTAWGYSDSETWRRVR